MKLYIFLFLIVFARQAHALDTSGLQISGAGDVVGAFNAPQNGGTQADDKISPREFEILLYSPIDHLFDATINTAAHIENGEQKFELHEGYLSSSKLIPN